MDIALRPDAVMNAGHGPAAGVQERRPVDMRVLKRAMNVMIDRLPKAQGRQFAARRGEPFAHLVRQHGFIDLEGSQRFHGWVVGRRR